MTEKPLFCLAVVCRVLNLRADGVIDSMERSQNLHKVFIRSDRPQAEMVCGESVVAINQRTIKLYLREVQQ